MHLFFYVLFYYVLIPIILFLIAFGFWKAWIHSGRNTLSAEDYHEFNKEMERTQNQQLENKKLITIALQIGKERFEHWIKLKNGPIWQSPLFMPTQTICLIQDFCSSTLRPITQEHLKQIDADEFTRLKNEYLMSNEYLLKGGLSD